MGGFEGTRLKQEVFGREKQLDLTIAVSTNPSRSIRDLCQSPLGSVRWEPEARWRKDGRGWRLAVRRVGRPLSVDGCLVFGREEVEC